MSFNEDQFYVTLPSNSSMNFFPENTTTHYKTKLNRPIRLDSIEDWEVGLAEIQYPHTWFNITEKNNRFSIYFSFGSSGKWQEYQIPSAYYMNISLLIVLINGLVSGQSIQVKYSKISKKVHFTVPKGKAVKLHHGLTYMLGFHQDEVVIRHDTISPFTVDLDGQFYNLYIYSDVLQHQLVGDSFVPLLRTVTTEGEDGKMIQKSFTKIHYSSVSRTSFETLEIDIRTDTGDSIPFQRGRVVVKLHFRRKK